MDTITKLNELEAQAIRNSTADLTLGQQAANASKLDFSAVYDQSMQTLRNDAAAAEELANQETPSTLDTATSAFRLYNPISSAMVNKVGNDLSYEVDTEFDSVTFAKSEELWDIPFNDKFALAGAVNEQHANDMVSQIRAEMHDRDVLDKSSAFVSTPLIIAAELGNPINYIPVVGQVSQVNKVNTAIRVGLSAMGQTALSETALHATQQTRTQEETMMALAGSLVLAGGVEFGLSSLKARKINKEITENMKARVEANDLHNDGGIYRNKPDEDINKQAATVLDDIALEQGVTVKDVVKGMKAEYGFDMTPTTAGMIQLAERNADYYNKVAKQSQDWFSKFMPKTDFHQMMNIDSPLGKKLGVDFFEAASGYGGNLAVPTTAALKKDMYSDHLSAQFVPEYATAYTEYAKSFSLGARMKDGTYGNTIRDAFDTELSDYLSKQYSNSRFGTSYDMTVNPAVAKAAKAWNSQMKQGLQLAKDKHVAGFEGTAFHDGYVPLRIDQAKLRAKFGTGTKLKEVSKSMQANLLQNSPGLKRLVDEDRADEAIKMAESIASNYVARIQLAAQGVDQQSMDGLLGLVARNDLVSDLKLKGMKEEVIDEVLDNLNVRRADTGTGGTMRESHARLPLDLHGTYEGVRLNDILQNNMESIGIRYNATLGGRAALAEKGIELTKT